MKCEFASGDIIVPIGSFRKHVVIDVCDKGVIVDEMFNGRLSNWHFLLSPRNILHYVCVGKWDSHFGEVKDERV